MLPACTSQPIVITPKTKPTLTAPALPTEPVVLTIPTESTPLPDIAESWVKRLLAGDPCAAPCWEGITPGKTTKTAAVTLLTQLPWATINDPTGVEVYFWLLPERIPASSGGIGFAATAPNTVTWVSLKRQAISFGRLLDVYGEPSEVMAEAQIQRFEGIRNVYDLSLFYPQAGIILSATTSDKPVLNRDLRITEIVFLAPSDPYRSWEYYIMAQDRGAEFRAWKGFQSFVYYCSGMHKAELCIP
jgi:hypothetical protein